MTTKTDIAYLKQELAKQGTPERAEGEKKYLKSDLEHYGVTVPQLRKIAQKWYSSNSQLPINEYLNFCLSLWESRYFEERSLALYLLELRSTELTYDHIDQIESMLHKASGWAHVDLIAIHLIGAILEKDRSVLILLPIWASSENFWVRRAAILAQVRLFRKAKGNMKVFADIVRPMLKDSNYASQEERFFIRKAIGWALRERAKADPDSVVKFVNRYHSQLSSLTWKEATRNLAQKHQQQLVS